MSAQRFVLFCGNLPYTCDGDRIKEFFKPIVTDTTKITPRLLTKKGTGEPKGCAFVDFSDGNELKRALKLHHSTMDGRKVRIEVTAGGGGTGEVRQKKIKEKQKKLKKERQKDFKKVKSSDEVTKKKGKRKHMKPERKEPEADPRIPSIVEKFKLNSEGEEYLTRQPPWLIDQIEEDFRLPQEEVRDVTGLLIKFSQGAKNKAYKTWDAQQWTSKSKKPSADEATSTDKPKSAGSAEVIAMKKRRKSASVPIAAEESAVGGGNVVMKKKRKREESLVAGNATETPSGPTKTEVGTVAAVGNVAVKKKKKRKETPVASDVTDIPSGPTTTETAPVAAEVGNVAMKKKKRKVALVEVGCPVTS